MATTARLPGIQFDVVPVPTCPTLVRMDIAVFVGFAASGPIDLPVAVESVADFEDIFGDDLPLVADAGPNQPVYAYLPSAVRAFFRNFGLRCWVVRVTGAGAASDTFPIPNLSVLESGAVTPAVLTARSPGSWADDLNAGIALRAQALVVNGFTATAFPSLLGADAYSVGLALQVPGQVSTGDLLRLTFPDSGNVLWLFVDSMAAGAGNLATATGATSYWEPALSPPASPSVQALPLCELITMDLFAQSGAGDIRTLTGLGFAPAHLRYIGRLPDDATLYAMGAMSGLAQDASHPRFPLAGPVSGTYFLPIGAGAVPEFAAAPLPSGDAIVRNGLASFGSDVFLDPALADTTAIDLMREADYIRYQSPEPRLLHGIHAALAVDEAAIIAAPDAVQRGWFPIADTPLASPPPSSPLAHPEWWHFLDCRQAEPTPTGIPRNGQFEPCGLGTIDAPQLTLVPPEGGRYELVWTPLSGAVDYLEEAVDPQFLIAGVIYTGSSGKVIMYGRPAGDYYYRLRRQVGSQSSDYSNGRGIRIQSASGWQATDAAQYQNQPLLDVHGGLLRMCAARGDMFAVLALPGHYRERDAMAHAAQLQTALRQAEQTAFSFGGIYHPWLTGREENDLSEIRSNPPDGAACGIMAMRSLTRGPWIAPANEPLHGVVALTPPISRDYWQALQDAQINLVRQEPQGFLWLSASTLSGDPDLELINVRRLMSFLRKTVLKAGVDYVFEPNSDSFRRGVQRGMEKVLDMLFLRGAFAGRTSGDAYQVVADTRVNTAATIARGQFFVEIKVAPSVPMRYLTVRLVQTADRTFVTEGA